MPEKYVIRRTSDTNYQLERADGTVLVAADATTVEELPTDPDVQPAIPGDIAEPVVTYAENNNALHEWRVMQWVGIRYVDDQ